VIVHRPVARLVGTTRYRRFAFWAGLMAITTALTLSLISVASAHAATYCVQAPGCSGTDTTLQQALSYAAASTDNDTVQIGPGIFSGNGFRYAPGANGGQLTIQGAGPKQTILTGASIDGTVLEVDEDASHDLATVEDLGLQVPRGASYTQGLSIARGLVEHVVATSPGTSGYPIGLRIGDGTIARHDTADVGFNGFAGIEMTGSPASAESRVEDSTAVGRWGILVEAGPGSVTRTRIQAVQEGIEACNTEADVDDTLIQLSGKYAIGLAVQAGGRCGGDPAAMNAKHVTIVGDNSPATTGVGAVQVFADPYAATLDLRHSIIRGIAYTLAWRSTGPATATIGSTDADLSAGAQTGTPGTLNLAGGNIDSNPRFVDPGSSNYHLLWSSPAIDAGPSEPFAVWESRLDLADRPRIVDGDGNGTARRDMGAYEYQHRRPKAKADASPDKRPVGRPFKFSAVGSTDPDAGDALRYRWRFDDGAKAKGITVEHAFSDPGKHRGRVRVTDPTGLRANAAVTVRVKAH
jgi:PKD domain-containing protein